MLHAMLSEEESRSQRWTSSQLYSSSLAACSSAGHVYSYQPSAYTADCSRPATDVDLTGGYGCYMTAYSGRLHAADVTQRFRLPHDLWTQPMTATAGTHPPHTHYFCQWTRKVLPKECIRYLLSRLILFL